MTEHIAKLPNAPLQEVIFEVHWKLDIDKDSGLFFDQNFQLASGRFDSLASAHYPTYLSLKPPMVPDQYFSFKAVHQYWNKDKSYPLIQLGPGLFTVNDTDKNYIWIDFKKRILRGLQWLVESYRGKLNIDFIELRYIDAVELSAFEADDLPLFLKENLNIIVENKTDISDSQLEALQVVQRFSLGDNSDLNLLFTNGTRNIDEAPVILWNISVNRRGHLEINEIEKWIENSHSICSNLFKKIVSVKLYEQFSKANK
jgi:uncharacterized protein (TIGR04255 family)